MSTESIRELAALRAEIAALKEERDTARATAMGNDELAGTLRERAERAEKERDEWKQLAEMAENALAQSATQTLRDSNADRDALRARLEAMRTALEWTIKQLDAEDLAESAKYGEQAVLHCAASGYKSARAALASEAPNSTRKEGEEPCPNNASASMTDTTGESRARNALSTDTSNGAPSSDPTDAPEPFPFKAHPTRWRSYAEWNKAKTGVQWSDDLHYDQEEAEAVCEMLQARGFGGDGKAFPRRTGVIPPQPADGAAAAGKETL